HRAFGLEREIRRAMSCQHDDGENRNRYGVPVEQTDMATDIEVREKRHREISLRIDWNAARDVAGGCAEKNRKQEIGADENEIPIRLPKTIVNVTADFNGDAAQNQAPHNQKQREIITRERRSHQPWEDCDQRSTKTDQPHFMP